MTRVALLTTLAVTAAACQPTLAEIHCGQASCRANQRCEPTNLVCVLDEAPELIVDEPRAGSLIAGELLVLRGSVSDDNGPATLELSLDEGKSWLQVPLSGTHFTARLALAPMDYQPLSVTLRAHDSHQQATRHRVGLMVDNVAPALILGAPLEGAILNLAWFAAAGKVSGLASDGSGVAALGVDLGAGPRPLTPSSDQFELDWAAPVGEDDVSHTIRVTAVDLAGNRASLERKVRVDVVAPQLSFSVPEPNELLGPAFFREAGGLVRGLVSFGARVTAELGSGPQSARVDSGRWSVAWSPAPGLDFRVQPLVVVAVDEAGNKTRAERRVTVDLVPPVLSFTAPGQGARLNAASFANGDEVAVGWTVADGDPRVSVGDGAGRTVGGSLKVQTSPTDNPTAYRLALTAKDRAGNQSEARLSFEVDRVHPTVLSQIPVAGSRNNSTTATIEFSEEVSGAPGLILTPFASGAWTTSRRFEVAGLAADSVFTAVAGPVADAFGNPAVIPEPARFHTAARLPVSGPTLMNDVLRFKVAADADGVLTLFTVSPTTPAGYRWARVNPRTGAVEDNRPAWAPVVGGDFGEFDVYASASANADLSAHRVSAATTLIPLGINERRSWVRLGDSAASSELGMVGVIPTRPFPAEGTGLGEIGLLKRSAGSIWYARAGLGADLAVGLGPPTAMGFAGDRWEMLEVRNQVFKRRSFECRPSAFGGGAATCGLTALQQWTDVASGDATSYAIADRCSVYLYDTSAGARVLRVEPHCAGRDCPAPWSAVLSQAAQLRVASDRRGDNSFIAAQRTSTGAVQLLRLSLDADCRGAFGLVAAPVAVPAGASFEPVSLGGKAALVYVDQGNALKVYAP